MKKIFFSAVLASFMFASCQNEEFVGSQESQMEEFTIEVTRGTDSRVYMDGSVAKWSEGDALYVYGTNGVRGTLYLTSGANSKTATFTGVISGSSKNLTNAIFGNVTHNGDEISLTLNNVNAAECDAPMFGAFSADKGSISLDYICGLVPVKITEDGNGDLSDVKLGGVGVSTLSLVDGKWVPGAAYADITIDNVPDGQTFYVPFFTTTEENAVKTPLTIKVGDNASYTYAPNTKSGALSTTESPVLTYNTSSGSLTPTTETTANKNIGVSSLYELTNALASGQKEIALNADITSSDIITISSDVVLYGNGKTLESTKGGEDGRAINVGQSGKGDLNVTIKDLTINASGQRGINIIQGSHNVTLENVTVTAYNYAVNVASSAPNSKVTINESGLTGLNVVNIAAIGTTMEINNTILTCDDQNEGENYAAIAINPKDGSNSKVIVNGGVINVEGASIAGEHPGSSNIVINGTTGNNEIKVQVCYIDYGNNYCYAFATLEDAIAIVKEGETITLCGDITVLKSISHEDEITIDCNGYTITGVENITLSKGQIINSKN